MTRGRETGGLSRWSRLKREARARERAEASRAEASRAEASRAAAVAAAPAQSVAPAAAAADEPDYEAMPDAEALEALGLPDPDALRRGDDVRAFLAARVPARLRARALRALWRSDPVFAVLDGLNDYDQDFALVAEGPVSTLYEVGRGFLRDAPPEDEACEGGAETEIAEGDGGAEAEGAAPSAEGVAARAADDAAGDGGDLRPDAPAARGGAGSGAGRSDDGEASTRATQVGPAPAARPVSARRRMVFEA